MHSQVPLHNDLYKLISICFHVYILCVPGTSNTTHTHLHLVNVVVVSPQHHFLFDGRLLGACFGWDGGCGRGRGLTHIVTILTWEGETA